MARRHLVPFALILGLACGQPSETLEVNYESPADYRVLRLEELTFTDIDALSRDRTIFFLTFGNLEEHGPHLPVGSDYVQAVGVRDGVIDRLRDLHPDLKFVLMPVVPLGESGANDMAHQFDHVGTYGIRYKTLRDVTIDLGSSIARQGFEKILLFHHHGPLLHNLALSEAADFVSERYGVRMVNVTSRVLGTGFYSSEVLAEFLGDDWEDRIGFEGHAGAAESSMNLYLRGDLVKPEYKTYEPFFAANAAEFYRTYEKTEGWRGYWGAPALASAEIGEALAQDLIDRSVGIVERVIAGEDLSGMPSYPESLPPLPEAEALVALLLERYDRQTAEIEAWLAERQSGEE